MREIKMVIMHCAATPDSSKPEYDFDVDDIDEWHKARGWRGVGYHRVIKRNGTIQRGREDKEIGAHAKGHNRESIGICYIGSYKPTKAQLKSIQKLFLEYKEKYGLEIGDWYCHYEFANKDCPGFSKEFLHDLLKKA